MGSERWERDRVYERDRYDDDRFYMKGGRGRERSEDGYDRRRYHDDDLVSDRRYYEQDSRYSPRREPARQPEYERRVVMERERDREDFRESSPKRPGFLRRQSSLDTFDRRPLRHVLHQREEYPPPARREDIYRDDYRAPPYAPIPLPRTRGLPPPGRRQDRHYDDYRPEHFHDDEFRPLPERIREREVVRERDRRDPSRDSRTTRTHSRRSASRSSSSRSSSSSGGTAIHSQYPKRGKTKIPARLVSKRALIDLGYPFFEESAPQENVVIVQKALGQENIDELLKLSEEYNRADQEVAAARSSAGSIVEERIEEIRKEEIIEKASTHAPPPPPPPPASVAPPPPPPPAPVVVPPPPPPPAPVVAAPGPIIVDAGPRPVDTVEIVDRTVVRESSSPTRSTSSWDSGHHHHHHHRHRHRQYEEDALVVVPHSRSRSRSRRDIRAEIKALERELVHRPRAELEREVVRTERLPSGELVIYEEEVERTIARPKPPRIEKDKKGPSPALIRAMMSTLT
ncbi:hypothetical protein AAL_02014 [Moelleriella libera RCEF 2490]|uniref:DUF8035 domain-containing protein n=1 Tax=Moelleriella libera RCEF 2490 TaxID=1081109 RepID=A0A162IWJ6_9HYPO|nr:hypothetical protein AAL_02014 [Moelleriella libera RCEF 2490]